MKYDFETYFIICHRYAQSYVNAYGAEGYHNYMRNQDPTYDAFYADDIKKGFFHGHTYSGNPVACSAAIAGIELFISSQAIEYRRPQKSSNVLEDMLIELRKVDV